MSTQDTLVTTKVRANATRAFSDLVALSLHRSDFVQTMTDAVRFVVVFDPTIEVADAMRAASIATATQIVALSLDSRERTASDVVRAGEAAAVAMRRERQAAPIVQIASLVFDVALGFDAVDSRSELLRVLEGTFAALISDEPDLMDPFVDALASRVQEIARTRAPRLRSLEVAS